MLANAEGLCQAITGTLPAAWNLVELSYAASNFGNYAAAASPSIASFFTKAHASSKQNLMHRTAAGLARTESGYAQSDTGGLSHNEVQLLDAGQHCQQSPDDQQGCQLRPDGTFKPFPAAKSEPAGSLWQDSAALAASMVGAAHRSGNPVASGGLSRTTSCAAGHLTGNTGPVGLGAAPPHPGLGLHGSVASSSSQPSMDVSRAQQQLSGSKRKALETTGSSMHVQAALASEEMQAPPAVSAPSGPSADAIFSGSCSSSHLSLPDKINLQCAIVHPMADSSSQHCDCADGGKGPAPRVSKECSAKEHGDISLQQSAESIAAEARLCTRLNQAAVEEQRRILRDIELRRLAGLPGKHKGTLLQKVVAKPPSGARSSSQQTLFSSKHFNLKSSS